MEKRDKRWEVLKKLQISKLKNLEEDVIVRILLENRGIKTKKQIEEFLNPKKPVNIRLRELGLNNKSVTRAVDRIKKAISEGEDIVIYGDYDADGICATAILWETLYKLTKKVTPYIPDRFSEGYGINSESISKLKAKNSKLELIVTVDNGIVAFEAIEKANELGIDVMITDHHQKDIKLPKAYSIIHADKISGSGVAWILSREILRKFQIPNSKLTINSLLELATIGTIADQLPLTGTNRSIAKYGLDALNKTERIGLLELYKEAGIMGTLIKNVGTYEVNYLVAPRLNAMGRLEHAMDSLRLLCTTIKSRAEQLAAHIGQVNKRRQNVVDEVLEKAKRQAGSEDPKSAIVIAGSYHEGVIGLAAGKLVEEFGRPAIVFSEGKDKSKASARSIPGFDIIKEIKKLDNLLLGAGGHPMAAGLSIETKNLKKFKSEFQKNSIKLLTDELLTKTLKIDMDIEFDLIKPALVEQIDKLKPFGIGNPSPTFMTKNVAIASVKPVGSEGKHMKFSLEKDGKVFEAIVFNFTNNQQLTTNNKVDIAYSIEENIWNGNSSLQLKIKDLKLVS